MATILQKRATLVQNLEDIANRAKSAGRSLTTSEVEQIREGVEKVRGYDEAIRKSDEADALMKSLGQNKPHRVGSIQSDTTDIEAKEYLDTRNGFGTMRKQWAEQRGTKSLLAPGVSNIELNLVADPVMLDGRGSRQIWDLLPVVTLTTPNYRYLRQVSRDLNPAVVQPGDVKPTSGVRFEEVTGALAVVAHLAEPVDTYWTEDFPELITALEKELLYGLVDKEEQLAMSGDGLNGNPTGILNTSGIQTQAFREDSATTVRAAITNLELLGYTPGAVVMHPKDWEAMETAKDQDGRYLLEGPVDRAKKTLWGVDVCLSTYVGLGQSLVLDPDSARLMTDRAIRVEATGSHEGGFARNEVLIRVEHRIDVAVIRPRGIVKTALTATP